MSPLRIRREQLADNSLVVVRGGELDSDSLRRDAVLTFRRFGEYGVSVLAVQDDAALDELARSQLKRFEVLTLMTAGSIRAAGLELRPTFRRPHYTVVFRDLESDLIRLRLCDNERRQNSYFSEG